MAFLGYVNDPSSPYHGQPVESKNDDGSGGYVIRGYGFDGGYRGEVYGSSDEKLPPLSQTLPDYNNDFGSGYKSPTKPVINTAATNAAAGMPAPAGVAPYVSTQSSTPAPISASTSITNPIPIPESKSGAAANEYNTSLAGQLASQKAAVQAEADKRAADYQAKIDALDKEQKEFDALRDAGMEDLLDTTNKQTAEKRAAYDLEKQRFDENYNANQALIGELDGLLSQGNALIQQMQDTTGLASIMQPRIAKTMTDVAARAGVIQAVLSARNGQMAQAQNQLQSSLQAISSIYSDQIDYYKTLLDYYTIRRGEVTDEKNLLTREQKDYLDVKLNLLNQELAQTQATADYITKQMLDPQQALAFAKAGVKLTDSIEQINAKLANYAYSQEVANISNNMAEQGYSTTPIAGVTPVQVVDSNGVTRNYYKQPDKGAGFNEISPGATVVDNQGNVIYQAPTAAQQNADAGVSSAGTTTTLAGLESGKTFVSGNFQYTPEDYKEDHAFLTSRTLTDAQGNPNMGSDGYVNPRVYLNMMKEWTQNGGLQSDFLKIFPVDKYVNPANTWPEIIAIGGGTKPKASSSSGSEFTATQKQKLEQKFGPNWASQPRQKLLDALYAKEEESDTLY